MRRIICFSAIVLDDKTIVGNCFVAYHYEKVFSEKWNMCYVNSILYIKNDERFLNSEVWNETQSQNWFSVNDGLRLVQQTLNNMFENNKIYKILIKDEKYVIEKGQKQIYILKDYVNNIQYLQIRDNGSYQEEKITLDISIQEIEEKYLNI